MNSWVSVTSQWLDSHRPCGSFTFWVWLNARQFLHLGRAYVAHSGLSDPCGALTQYILRLLVFFLCLFLWLTIASLDLMQSSLSLHYEACYHICFIHRISVLTKPRWFIMQKSSLLTDAVTPPWLSHSLKDWNTSTTCRRHVSEQEYPAPLSQESSQRHTFTITHSFHNSPSSSCRKASCKCFGCYWSPWNKQQ